MNLEDAIRWYNQNRKQADSKVPGLSASNQIKSGLIRNSMLERGMSACINCGRGVSDFELSLTGICSNCVKIADEYRAREIEKEQQRITEVRSGYRGAIRAQYVSTSTPFATGGIVDPKSWEYRMAFSLDKTQELEQRIRELTEQLEKLKGTGMEATGGNDVLITGRKFRKTEGLVGDDTVSTEIENDKATGV